MGLQTSNLVMVALGVNGDVPPIALQPKLADGVHLRWAFPRARGFPWYGYYLFRRPYEPRGERCLGPDLAKHAPGTDLGTSVPNALGVLSSADPIVLTEVVAPAGRRPEISLERHRKVRLDLPDGEPAFRARVHVAFLQSAEQQQCVDFRRLRPELVPGPLAIGKVTFAFKGPRGEAVPRIRLVAPPGGTRADVALDAGALLKVELPTTTRAVQFDATGEGRGSIVEALDDAGRVVASEKPQFDPRKPTTLELRASSELRRLRVRTPAGLLLVHRLCWIATARAVRIPVTAYDGPMVVDRATLTGRPGELTKRVNGVTSALLSQPFALTVGQQYEVVFEALGSRLRITVNRVVIAEVFDGDLTHGSVGFHTWARPLPRFDRVTVESVARTLGPWTIHDHGGIELASRWQVWQRTFRQDAAFFASAPSSAMIDRSGSAAVTGDSGWTDVRIVARFDAALAGAAGLVFRWQDADHHYRLLFDGTARQSRLVQRSGGASTVLWSAAAPFTSMEVVVEAIGNRLRAWVDDVLLFDVRDDGLSTGRAGVLAIDGVAAIWSEFMVRHVEPKWEDWHQFDAAIGWRAAGRRLRVFAGCSADATVTAGAGEEHLFQAAAPATFRPRLYAPGVDLRLVDATGQERHLRRWLPEAAYVDQPSTRVLRAADGTGMLVFVPGAGPVGTHLAAGEYRLRLTYRRDNTAAHVGSLVLSQAGDTSDETAFIDMPWEVSS